MSGRLDIEIVRDSDLWQAGAEAALRRGLEAAFEAERGGAGEVSVLLTDDAPVRRLNAQFRGKDKPTDVLSFPSGAAPDESGEPLFLGDVALAYESCRRGAEDRGIALDDHLAHLGVHAMLHLFGHDHEEPEDAARMEAAEIRILTTLGIADPYEESIAEASAAAAAGP